MYLDITPSNAVYFQKRTGPILRMEEVLGLNPGVLHAQIDVT